MRARAVFPGAVLAGALTAGALLALVLALGMRGDGPLSFGLGDSDGSARLSEAPGAAARVGGRQASPLALPVALSGGGGAAPAVGVVPRRPATVPRATTRRRSRANRPGVRAPSRPRTPVVVPAPTAAPPATAPAATPRPVATATPAPVAVKVHGHGHKVTTPNFNAPKTRVKPGKPAPPAAPPRQVPAPAPSPPSEDTSPPAAKRRVEPPGQAKKGAGEDDGPLKHVPGGHKP